MTIYLDHNATAPVRPEVADAVMAVLRDTYGNPSAPYTIGQNARKAVAQARRQVAALLQVEPARVTFTSGGTEANNLAITGTFFGRHDPQRNHLITTAIEHPSVLRTCEWLARRHGADLTVLEVSSDGRVDPAEVFAAVRPETLIVAVMQANNETGVLQPVQEIGDLLNGTGIHFHVDGVQVAGRSRVDVGTSPCHSYSLSAHKFGGMKGTGALISKIGTAGDPILHGGHQEAGLRAGTENVPGIVAMGTAAEQAMETLDDTAAHVLRLRAVFDNLATIIPVSWINGHRDLRLPNTTNLCFLNADAMSVVLALSSVGIHIGTGSACASQDQEPSRILKAMGLSDTAAFCSVRISTGPENTLEDAEAAAKRIVQVVNRIRLVTDPEGIGTCDENCPCFLEV